MAEQIEPYLRQGEIEFPDKAPGVARLRSDMWDLVAKGEFPRTVGEPVPQPISYTHPLFVFFPLEGTLLIGPEHIFLSPTQSRMLQLLTGKVNHVVPKTQLERILAGYDHSGVVGTDPTAVKTHISKLRGRIANGREVESPIVTVKGFGYMLVDPTRSNGNGNVTHP